MTDYIRREAATKIAEDGELYAECYHDRTAGYYYKKFKQDLLNISAADVRPVVRAHWIETAPINEKTMKPLIVKGPHLKCSNCGSIEFQRNYCPNCGAEMEEIIYNSEDK